MKTGRNGDTRPYFPFYASDWIASGRVRMMSFAAQGAFIQALCIQWRAACPRGKAR